MPAPTLASMYPNGYSQFIWQQVAIYQHSWQAL